MVGDTDYNKDAAAGQASTEPKDSAADPYYGKSREDVIREFEDLRGKYDKTYQERSELAEFVGRVSPFFKQDGGTVSLNDDMLKQYASAKGWFETNPEPEPQAQETMNAGAVAPDGNYGDDMDGGGDIRQVIRDVLKQEFLPEVQKAAQESVKPVQQQLDQDRYNRWNKEMTDKHPEYAQLRTKVGEWVHKHQFPIRDINDLETALNNVKMAEGAYVDRAQAEAHNQMLMDTLQTIQPGAGMPKVNDAEASNAQLMGLDMYGDEKAQSVTQALFGKTALKP